MIPSDASIEAAHLNLHINQERQQDLVFSVIGHISGVDPTTNKIKVVIPTWTNDNATYMESGWVPLGTAIAGNQYGIQLLPFGGATVTDPTGQKNAQNGNQPAAEQVLVHVLGKKKGLYVVGVQMFNTVDVPPTGYEDKSGVKASSGEWLFKHASGTYQYFDNQGNFTLETFTNPAPVLQTDQTPTSVTPTMNLSMKTVGTNSNKNGATPATVTSTMNLMNTVSGGATQTGITNINIDAGTSGTATLNITVTGKPNTVNVNVMDGTINMNSKDMNFTATDKITLVGGQDTLVIGAPFVPFIPTSPTVVPTPPPPNLA